MTTGDFLEASTYPGLMGAGALTGLSAALIKYPGLRGTLLGHLPQSLKPAPASYKPPNNSKTITRILEELHNKGIKPESAKIGVAGLPGSGKSTIAAELAKKLGIDYVELDAHLVKGSSWDKVKTLLNRPKGSVMDHTTLLTDVSPTSFDAMVWVNPNESKRISGLLSREYAKSYKDPSRANWSSLADDIDADKFKKAMNVVFGTQQHRNSAGDVQFVVRPTDPKSKISEKLLEKRVNPSGLNFKDRLLSLVDGKKTVTENVGGKQGLSAFNKKYPKSGQVVVPAATIAGGGLGYLGAELLTKEAYSPSEAAQQSISKAESIMQGLPGRTLPGKLALIGIPASVVAAAALYLVSEKNK